MRVMPIRIVTGKSGWHQMKASFLKNNQHYMQEALGLAIFMISACFFSAELFSPAGIWNHFFTGDAQRNMVMGLLMGITALCIFYSPFTAPSGSQINPAVTLTFLRLDKMCPWDALFYVLFQFAGGTVAVYIMQVLMGDILTGVPVHSAVTVPAKNGTWYAAIIELVIAFVTMSVVLFTSTDGRFKKYTRIIAACLVCSWVIIAGPISGFGMNPARSFASALPSGIWTSFWIYICMPVAGMLGAAEFLLFISRQKAPAVTIHQEINK